VKARLRNALLSHSPLVFGSDWEFNAITVPPNEAQFVETMRLSATQIANIYGLPPEDVGGTRGGSLTYATVELNQLDRSLAMRPWLVLLEHKFASLLPERQYVRFNADAMVRTDLKTRWEVHQIQLATGVLNRDEVRATEDLPPLPNGEGQDYKPVSAPPPEAAPQAQQPPPAQGAQRMWVIPA
jgi:HK97 family phage portal protein